MSKPRHIDKRAVAAYDDCMQDEDPAFPIGNHRISRQKLLKNKPPPPSTGKIERSIGFIRSFLKNTPGFPKEIPLYSDN